MKKEIIKKLAKKYHLSEAETLKVVDSQFEMVANTMKAGKFDLIRLPYFGLFKPIIYKLKKKGLKEVIEEQFKWGDKITKR